MPVDEFGYPIMRNRSKKCPKCENTEFIATKTFWECKNCRNRIGKSAMDTWQDIEKDGKMVRISKGRIRPGLTDQSITILRDEKGNKIKKKHVVIKNKTREVLHEHELGNKK